MTTIRMSRNLCGLGRTALLRRLLGVAVLVANVAGAGATALAADVPGSKDPPGMKRYEGSEIIAYREPKFDEYLLPLGVATSFGPPKYEKSAAIEGQVSRYTYIAPAGRTPAEVFRNYKLEFERLGLETLYEKKPGDRGWFGPTFDKVADEDGLGQILAYNQDEERLLVGRTKGSNPVHYLVFVTAYRDGVIPARLKDAVQKGRTLAHVAVIAPDVMEKKMVFVNADEMKKSLQDEGRVALYGIFFDTDKDVVKPESKATLEEVAKLLAANPSLRLRVVGHTDNQGKADYNLDLSRRRAASVVGELTGKLGVDAARLDSFGCGLYAPVASNETEDGRAKNRRVELVQW
jgi:outer membrane protein OmpA-like peptidoglycan-associated protein